MAAEYLPGEFSDTQNSQIFNVSILTYFANPTTVISLLSENYSFQRKKAFWVCNKLRETNKEINKPGFLCMFVIGFDIFNLVLPQK
jgi:hypothetical protein